MSLTINLPPRLQNYIEREVAAGRYPSEEAAVIDAVELVLGLEAEDPELVAALAEADRGEVLVLTSELRNEIRSTAERHLRDGHTVRHDVTY